MTPVLIIPVLNRPDLLARCIASIDIPVRLLVIDNGGAAFDVVPEDAWLLDMPTNLGYPASVNLGIKCYPHELYWLVSNADVEYGPGDLQRLCDAEGDWVGLTDWRTFKLTAHAVETVGFWDENYHPAFCEDADYERRCDLAGLRRTFIEGQTSHVGSVTLEDHRADNARSYPENVAYHARKWGAGVRMPGGFATPFDRGQGLGDWTLDLRRLRSQAWRPHR